MASAADNMATNLNLSKFAQATELKKRLWFTVGALIVFRLMSHVPLPGIDPRALATLYETTRGGVLDFFNTFSGGSVEVIEVVAAADKAQAKKNSVRDANRAAHGKAPIPAKA